MTKEDLETGMVVQIEDGSEGVILLGSSGGDIINYSDGTWNELCYIEDDLSSKEQLEIGIVKVWECESRRCILRDGVGNKGKLLWEREQEKTFTLDGVEYSESSLRSLIRKATQ